MTIQSTRMIPSWNMPVESPPPPSKPGSEYIINTYAINFITDILDSVLSVYHY